MNKITKWIVGALCAVALLTSTYAADTVATAKTAPAPTTQVDNNWTFSLSGVGATSTKVSGDSAFGLSLDLGHTGLIGLPVQYGVRQSISYANLDGSQTLLTTALYNDWTVFKHKALEVFAGANAALTYGNTTPLWTIAPEAGVRYYVKKDIALVGRVAYNFDLSNLSQGNKYNSLGYGVGIQFSF